MLQGLEQNMPVILLIILWTLPWKGVALWKAARNEDKKWFIALLVLNTLAVLEMLYIFIFSRQGDKDRRYEHMEEG